jgi:hypothetical protein
MYMQRVFRVLCLTILIGPIPVYAQNLLENNRSNIELSESYPVPGETIEATLVNQNSANLPGNVTWRINGETNNAYTNQRTITFTANELGTPTVLQARKSGRTIAQATVNPVYLDVHVEPITYTPNQYQGRAEVSPGSTVVLTALVEEAVKRDPSAYTYTWRVNGDVVEGQNWRGNNRIVTEVPFGGRFQVDVEVSRNTLGVIARERIGIPVVETETVFYRVSSLYGLSRNALGTRHTVPGDTITLRAVPYFIATEAVTPNNTEWKVDNTAISPDQTLQVTLEKTTNNRDSSVQFSQYNSENFSQQAQGRIELQY